jgi:tetratricopeptide (TPR) repeat protein
VSRPPRRAAALFCAAVAASPCAAAADAASIRLKAPRPNEATSPASLADERRSFDYDAFRARLESLWFQRKALLAAGREADAAAQAERIRAVCSEEGVGRLDDAAAALLIEARRHQQEGSPSKARASLELAEFFAPGSAFVRRGRAAILWEGGAGMGAALAEWSAALRAAFLEEWRSLALVNHLGLVIVAGLLGAGVLFAGLMLLRHHAAFRHDVEERLKGTGVETWRAALAWGILLAPLLLWVTAGWIVFVWLALLFRYMNRSERIASAVVLVVLAVLPPAFRAVGALRAMTEDPMVRAALATSDGTYEPERVVQIRRMIESRPDDPTLHFLLARVYANGRYLEEAFDAYRRVLGLDPQAYPAHVNLGNIYAHLGRYGEATVQYRRAMEIRPESALAYYNAYVTHSETFRFKEAQEYLDRGNEVDPRGMAELLQPTGRSGGRMTVADAGVDLRAVWREALQGKPLTGLPAATGLESAWKAPFRGLFNGWSLLALTALAAGPLAARMMGRSTPARPCIRCGRPFCPLCKSERDKGREYCTQCMHLFLVGEGLSSETKTRKLYEVERRARVERCVGRIASLVLPGSRAILRGRALRGLPLMTLWAGAWLCLAPHLMAMVVGIVGFDVRLGWIGGSTTPAWAAVRVVWFLGVAAAAITWVAANAPLLRRGEA